MLRPPSAQEVFFRAGSFTMGSTNDEIERAVALCEHEPLGERCTSTMFSSELAQHEVYLSDYAIDANEITVSAFEQCVARGECRPIAYSLGALRWFQPTMPVVLVSYEQASSYCASVGKRLPTEAEWERAARGTTRRLFPWGNAVLGQLANHGKFAWDDLDPSDGQMELGPVGSYENGQTPEGIADLAGNVEEWVGDYYAIEYPPASAVNPVGPGMGEERVVRGGSYVHGLAWLRGAARGHDSPNAKTPWRGFRCARTL